MSRARPEASLTPTKHRSGIIRALSNFSKPVEEWGVSYVPVLSTSVTPRRERTRWNSNSSSSATSSPRIPDLVDVFQSPSRVPPIRPLSIATVSTFGGWMSERRNEHDEPGKTFVSEDIGTPDPRPSVLTCRHRFQLLTPVRPKSQMSDPPSASPAGRISPGFDTMIHPLRMYPPSPSTPVPDPPKVTKGRNVPSLSQCSSRIPLPSTPSFDDRTSKASRATISTRRSHSGFPELNTKTANNDLRNHDETIKPKGQEHLTVTKSIVVCTDKQSSLPQDVGYVEALRLWYEDKENEALETWTHECKAVSRVETAGCALASMNTNQRL